MIVLSLLCFSWQCVSSIAVSLVSCSPGHSLPSWGTCCRSSPAWRFASYGNLNVRDMRGGVIHSGLVKLDFAMVSSSPLHQCSTGCSCVFSCSHQDNPSHLIPPMRCLTAEGEKGFYPTSWLFSLSFFLDNLSLYIINYPNMYLCFTRMFPPWCRENQMPSPKSVHRYSWLGI